MKVAIYSTHDFERKYLEEANDGNELVFHRMQLTQATTVLSNGCEAVSVFVNDDASKEVLQALSAQGVKYLLLRSAGFNHVDLEAAKLLGLKVANVPEYSPYAVAEHAVGLMLALNRKLIRAHNRVLDLNFSLDGLVGFDMHGKTVGLIGLGKIGEKVARIMRGFGCHVLAYDPYPNLELAQTLSITYVSLEELYKQADIISLHAPLNSKTKYILDKDSLELMKDGVMIINTSRGGLIHTKALIKGLKSRKIGYLGLDVYEEEKGLFFEDHSNEILEDDIIARLMTFSNVMITSHQGFLTETALRNISQTTFENLHQFITKGSASNEL